MSNLGRGGRGSQGSCMHQLFRSGFVRSGFPSSCFRQQTDSGSNLGSSSAICIGLSWHIQILPRFKLAQWTQWTSAIYTSRGFGSCIFFAFLPPQILPCNPAVLCGFPLSDVFMSVPPLTFWQTFCTVPCYCKPGAFIPNEVFPGKRKKIINNR